jgi:DNA-binding CsgD family transcriptional regulator
MVRARKGSQVRPDKLGDFLEAAYDMDADDQSWLAAIMETARVVWGRGGPAHGGIYDATDIAAFRPVNFHLTGFSDQAAERLMSAFKFFTPAFVVRSFRSLLVGGTRQVSLPELGPFLETMAPFDCADAMNINGLDPSGLGVFVSLWARDLTQPSAKEVELCRRMAHHMGAAYRCRRRLRESQIGRPTLDPTQGAEAILDAKKRIVHATGPARAKTARNELVETAAARERARSSKADAGERLGHWRPLTRARWTLVDSFERGGAKYIVARENQSCFPGLESLSDRERQTVAYLAVGQSTKETAYALGISDVTVRVLLGRAAAKLGVRSRAGLLAHDEVRLLCPDGKAPVT